MNRKKLLTVLISSLSVLFLIGVCLITTQVNDNNSAKELIQAGIIQDNESVTPPTNESNAVQNAEQSKDNNQVNNASNSSQSKIDVNNEKDDTFYTGPEEGDTVEAHNVALNFSTSNDINYTDVWYGIKDGTLTIGPTETDATPEKNEQAVNETPKWFNNIYSIFTVKIVTDEDEDGNIIYVTPECTKSWFSTACEPGDFHKPRISKIEGIENINMSGVTDASYMFCGIGLKWACNINTISSWSIEFRTLSNLTNAEGMFSNCQNNDLMNALCNTQLDKEKGPQIHPKKTTYMFIRSSLASLNMENWNISNCDDTSYMFNACTKLASISNIPTLKIDNEINLRSMFNNTAVTELDLTSWPATCNNKTNMTNLFRGNVNLTTINVKAGTNWSNCKDEYADKIGSMFYDIPNLIGCNGTKVSDKSVYKPEYARVDLGIGVGGSTTPGYFTASTVKGIYKDNVLTIVYDDKDHSSEGTVYQASNGAESTADVPWYVIHNECTNVIFDSSYSTLTDMPDNSFWFKDFTKLECIQIPSEVIAIGDSFCQNCTSLRKFVAGSDSSSNSESLLNDIGDNAFNGCSVLENFVIRKTDTENKTKYGTNVFQKAGSKDPTVAAPLIIASCEGDNRPTEVNEDHFYKYAEVSDEAGLKAMGDKTYNFVIASEKIQTGGPIFIDDVDCFLDLNGKTIDRGLTEKVLETEDGSVFIVKPTANLRVDDTSTYDIDSNNIGRITGGFTSQAGGDYKKDRSHIGGGFYIHGTLDFRNGRVTNCHAREGGAFGVTNEDDNFGLLRMYHGLVDSCSGYYVPQPLEKSYGGGACMVRSGAKAVFYGGVLKENHSASDRGGAICSNGTGAYLQLFNVKIYDNYINYGTEAQTKGSVSIRIDADVDDCNFIASEKAEFELEPLTNKGCPIYTINYGIKEAKITGHRSTGKYTVNVPANVHDFSENNTNLTITGIKGGGTTDGAFYNDTNLKKFVTSAFTDKFVVEDYAFNGCTGLENYVVRNFGVEVNDETTFTGNHPFDGIGSNDPTVAAPLIFASRNISEGTSYIGTSTTKSKVPSNATWYNYFEFNGDKTETHTNWTDQTYYYLTSDIKHTVPTNTGALFHVGLNQTARDIVFDLNHHTVDRGASTASKAGATVLLVETNSTVRIDDSSGVSQQHVGKLTGGNVNGATSYGSDNIGGGVFTDGTTLMVNGRVTGNKSGEGGGIAVDNEGNHNGSCLLRMYGGYIDDNDATTTDDRYGGGGIQGRAHSHIAIYGGEITNNRSASVGGGVQLNNGSYNRKSTFLIRGGVIKNNLRNYNATTGTGDNGGLHFFDYKFNYDGSTGQQYNNYNTDIKCTSEVSFDDEGSIDTEPSLDINDNPHQVAIPVIGNIDETNKKATIVGIAHNDPDQDVHIVGSYKDNGTAPEYECTVVGDGTNPISTTAPCVALESYLTEVSNSAFGPCTKKISVGMRMNDSMTTMGGKQLTIKQNALKNAVNLENFVVMHNQVNTSTKMTDSFVKYESGCFSGVGYQSTAYKAGKVQLCVAGGETVKTAVNNLTVNWLQSYTINNKNSYASGSFELKGNYYCSLLWNLSSTNKSTSPTLNIQAAATNCVLDLNGYNIDRGLAASAKLASDVGLVVHVNKGSKLRVDNTSNICAKHDSLGQIKNGSVGAGDYCTAGGIWVKGTLDFVNGNVCYNYGGECGGVCSANVNSGPGTSNILGGVIAHNSAVRGGGGGNKPGGHFNMYGGKIIRNTAAEYGGGLWSYASNYEKAKGSESTINLYGGTIGGLSSDDPDNNTASNLKGAGIGFTNSGSATAKNHLYINYNGPVKVIYNNFTGGGNGGIKLGGSSYMSYTYDGTESTDKAVFE